MVLMVMVTKVLIMMMWCPDQLEVVMMMWCPGHPSPLYVVAMMVMLAMVYDYDDVVSWSIGGGYDDVVSWSSIPSSCNDVAFLSHHIRLPSLLQQPTCCFLIPYPKSKHS